MEIFDINLKLKYGSEMKFQLFFSHFYYILLE